MKCDCPRIWIGKEPEKWASFIAITKHKETGQDVNVIIEKLLQDNFLAIRGDRPLDFTKFHKRLQTENLKRIISEGKEKATNT